MDKKFCVDYNLATRQRPFAAHSFQNYLFRHLQLVARCAPVCIQPDHTLAEAPSQPTVARASGSVRINCRTRAFTIYSHYATLAQLVEQRFRKAEVSSSTLESGL